ncbi:MAG: hypothetical protein K940chlam5_00858 [Candidatus Anoxychlamydiales bacterium]|nr:hypothetical protein [Candidatus Anoxychlamydiales bacterium]
MSVRPYFNQFSISFYEHIVGFNHAKIKELQNAFDNSGLDVSDLSIGDDAKTIESYYVDRSKSSEIDPNVLETLIAQLKNNIDLKKDLSFEFKTQRDHPKECRFFYRIYTRKFEEFSRLFLKTNPFPLNAKSRDQWQRAIDMHQKPPVYSKFTILYDHWKLNAMRYTHVYLDYALRMDLENRSTRTLTKFTYCVDKERQTKNRIAFRVINRTFIVIGIVFGLKMLLEPSSHYRSSNSS